MWPPRCCYRLRQQQTRARSGRAGRRLAARHRACEIPTPTRQRPPPPRSRRSVDTTPTMSGATGSRTLRRSADLGETAPYVARCGRERRVVTAGPFGAGAHARRGPVSIDGPSSGLRVCGCRVWLAGVVAAVSVLGPPGVAPRRLHGERVAIGERPVGQVPPGALVGVLGTVRVLPSVQARIIHT